MERLYCQTERRSLVTAGGKSSKAPPIICIAAYPNKRRPTDSHEEPQITNMNAAKEPGAGGAPQTLTGLCQECLIIGRPQCCNLPGSRRLHCKQYACNTQSSCCESDRRPSSYKLDPLSEPGPLARCLGSDRIEFCDRWLEQSDPMAGASSCREVGN